MIHDTVEVRLAAELKQFGNFLRLLRKSCNYSSRKEFSRLTCISMRTIERIEKGGINLQLDVIIKIARPFCLPVVALFDYKGSWRSGPGKNKSILVEDLATEKRKIGNRIRQLREDRCITLLDTEIELGISKKKMREMESGVVDVDARMLVRLASFFEVEFFELFDYDDF